MAHATNLNFQFSKLILVKLFHERLPSLIFLKGVFAL